MSEKLTLSKVRNMIEVKPIIIKDIDGHRGFYYDLKDCFIVANFCHYIVPGLEIEYRLGFKTDGKTAVEHLYDKLEDGKTLSENEKIAFYETVDLFDPSVQRSGKEYDFRHVLNKVEGLDFYTLSKKISKEEIKIFNKKESFVNIEEIINMSEIKNSMGFPCAEHKEG